MIILGITGTLGAGKGTVVDYLISKYDFDHFSVRTYLTQYVKSKGEEPNRDTFTYYANKLRRENSPSFFAEELMKMADSTPKNSIVESIRTTGEIEKLKEYKNSFLIAVDANIETRYHRIVDRKSETDQIDFAKFKFDENREMQSSDPNKQNLSECIKMADFIVYNDNDLDELYSQVDKIMSKILENVTV